MKLSKKLMIAACLTIAVPAAFAQQLTLSPATQTVSATAGATEATKFSFTLTTDTPVNITPSVNLPADVTFDSQASCGSSLPAGQSCQYIYSYKPTTPTATPETLSLTVKTDTGVSSNTATASLSAVVPTLPSVTFRAVYADGGDSTITITNQSIPTDPAIVTINENNINTDVVVKLTQTCPIPTDVLFNVTTQTWAGAYSASRCTSGCGAISSCTLAFACSSNGTLVIDPSRSDCAVNKNYFVSGVDNKLYILN